MLKKKKLNNQTKAVSNIKADVDTAFCSFYFFFLKNRISKIRVTATTAATRMTGRANSLAVSMGGPHHIGKCKNGEERKH